MKKIAGQANGLVKERDPLWPGEKTESWIVVILLNVLVPVPFGIAVAYLAHILCLLSCEASLDPHRENLLACVFCVFGAFPLGIILIIGFGVLLNTLLLQRGNRFRSLQLLSRVIGGFRIFWYCIPSAFALFMVLLYPLIEHARINNRIAHENIFDASYAGRDQRIEQLLAQNPALVNFRNDKGLTPLHLALNMAHTSTVRLLLQRGADVNAKSISQYPYCGRGERPVHIACSSGSIENCQSLLDHGADINSRTDDGTTPLVCALEHAQSHCAGFLLERGALLEAGDFEKVTKNLERGYPDYGQPETIQFLIDFGFNPSGELDQSSTPLIDSVERRHLLMAEVLLANGADPNGKNQTGETALHVACRRNHEEFVLLLLANGADVNAADNQGMTALHWAAKIGNIKICETLLRYKADVSRKNNAGQTPLNLAAEYAAKFGHIEIMEILRQHGENQSKIPHDVSPRSLRRPHPRY